jgi:hypothetical protein
VLDVDRRTRLWRVAAGGTEELGAPVSIVRRAGFAEGELVVVGEVEKEEFGAVRAFFKTDRECHPPLALAFGWTPRGWVEQERVEGRCIDSAYSLGVAVEGELWRQRLARGWAPFTSIGGDAWETWFAHGRGDTIVRLNDRQELRVSAPGRGSQLVATNVISSNVWGYGHHGGDWPLPSR